MLKRMLLMVGYLLVSGVAVLGWSGGPPPGRTGAPGESTCHIIGCHDTYAMNPMGGTFAISAPASYNPGDTLLISVALQYASAWRWGFEVTILNGSNNPVGNIILLDAAHTQLAVAGGGRQYVMQTTAGTYAGIGNVSPGWSFRWIAPSTSAGTVTVYACGVAANNDGTMLYDHIFTNTKAISQTPTCCTGTTGNVNMVGIVDVSDLSLLVAYLTSNPPPGLPCPAEANINAIGIIDVSDLSLLVAYLTASPTPALPNCP